MPPTAPPKLRSLIWAGVAFAIVFPSVVTWAYFFQAADAEQGVQRAVMAGLKLLQFAFPFVWVLAVLKERVDPSRPQTAGLAIGAAFGLAVTVAGWLLFDLWLRDTSWFAAALGPIQAKVAGFGLDAGWKFVALGAFYAVVHSLLEEYYWRWFVFGQLQRVAALWPAIVVSSLGFMAHHVLVLSVYFGWWTAPTLLLSAAVAIGGVFWAWLYARTGSLYGPWLSHAIVDAGIFVVGYSLLGQ
jgi:uncharacterized protein